MARADREESKIVLWRWLAEREGRLAGFEYGAPKVRDLTALIYFYRSASETRHWFRYSAQALRETWLHCGLVKTVIVTNAYSDPIMEFASRHSNVEVQIEKTLVPGDINALSVDCNSRMATRFETDYVLTVQDDGFPLRPGLSRYVGPYDFVGAPYRRRNALGIAAGVVKRSWPMNGGFSVRSKGFCLSVADLWNRHYSKRPFVPQACADDIFCTQTLPRDFPTFFRSMRWPTSLVAAGFSYEAALPMNRTHSPVGFHGAQSFCELVSDISDPVCR